MCVKLPWFEVRPRALALAFILLGALVGPSAALGQKPGVTVTVGPAHADVIGSDNVALQKAIDRVAAAGGGTVIVKAGTYTLANTVRLTSHLTLRGEGPEKTVLKKIPGVTSKLALDASRTGMVATVEDARGFAPGMGVTILDKVSAWGWTPSIRTIVNIEGNTLHFDRLLHMNYSVKDQGEVFNTFPLLAGYDVEDVQVRDLTVDGNRAESGILDGCLTGAIYFYHAKHATLANCQARNYPGDGISMQSVDDPVVDHCEAYGNAQLGIHLGTYATRGIVRYCRAHGNGQDGLYLCWFVRQTLYEGNQTWNNGLDGISLGHVDTDNIFIKNIIRGNARAGVFFRDEVEKLAAHRNTFEQNVIEDNGRPGAPGYAIWIKGETHDLKFISNTIRSHRHGDTVVQPVGIYIGPKADFVTCERNAFVGDFEHQVVDESHGGHNQLAEHTGN
jgi:hypothetical protein